jgi:hypothetical protein
MVATSCSPDSYMLRAVRSLAGVQTLGRPPLRPRARAAARPANVRSRIRSRSNSASAPKTWKISFPAGGAGVDLLGQRLEGDTTGLELPDGVNEVAQ